MFAEIIGNTMETKQDQRSKLDLEPNPFEKSFSAAKTEGASKGLPGGVTSNNPGSRITLPPIAEIESPRIIGDPNDNNVRSLRSGPLSPAMLEGPASHLSRSRRPTPRLGITDPLLHTGLTPFLVGEQRATPLLQGLNDLEIPTPNTLAQALVKIGETSSSGPNVSSQESNLRGLKRISPYTAAENIQSILPMSPGQQQVTAALSKVSSSQSQSPKGNNAAPEAYSPKQTLHTIADPKPKPTPVVSSNEILPQRHSSPITSTRTIDNSSIIVTTDCEAGYSNTARTKNNMELQTTVRDISAKAIYRDHQVDKENNYSRDQALSKRMASPTRMPVGKGQVANPKDKERNKKFKKGATANDSGDTSDQSLDDTQNKETPDEKRQQFLERNRIAALKCRQRKKQQLKELQSRVEWLTQDNERVHQEYQRLRDEAAYISTLLRTHRNCPIAKANGVIINDQPMLGIPVQQNPHPAPMAFSLRENSHQQTRPPHQLVPVPVLSGQPVMAPQIPPPHPTLSGSIVHPAAVRGLTNPPSDLPPPSAMIPANPTTALAHHSAINPQIRPA
ncbi:Transcription factor [Mycoemilia scoparia]|uniref:Transcription factor n=1 Tax=Mycoemilia scoparia TaxID=417184 RepID=A0A9W7ZUX4_9FUNG|nr:Transcription factor [Mycoemilia scoparia]